MRNRPPIAGGVKRGHLAAVWHGMAWHGMAKSLPEKLVSVNQV